MNERVSLSSHGGRCKGLTGHANELQSERRLVLLGSMGKGEEDKLGARVPLLPRAPLEWAQPRAEATSGRGASIVVVGIKTSNSMISGHHHSSRCIAASINRCT